MSVKLLITEIENADPRPFGQSGTLHYSVILRTADSEELTAMISENLLRKAGVTEDDLDDIVGCHISVGDQFDRDGVMSATSEERVEQVLDGTYRLLFCSSANAKLIKSDVFLAERKKSRADEKASLRIRQEEQRMLEKKKKSLERLLALKTEAKESVETPIAKTDAEPVAETDANLDANDESAPF